MASNFTSYGVFKTGLAAWMDVSSTDLSSTIDDLITVAETRIFREARTRDMEEAISTSIGSGVVAVPSGYVAMKFCYIDTDPVQHLERRSPDWIYRAYPTRSAEDVPLYFAREQTNFIFGPYPDSSYTFKGVYYKRLTAIVTTLNALFNANPDLYLFACLAESEIIIGRDKRIPIWEAKYKNILLQVNGEDKTEEHSGSVLQMRLG